MATGYPQKSYRSVTRTSRYRDLMRKKSRKLHLEQLEDRRVMAVAGPTLVALSTNAGDKLLSDVGLPISPAPVVHTSPRELDFLFAEGQKIDASTLATGFTLVGSGADGIAGSADDVVITPGYTGLLDDPRSVVMRFAAALPDGAYQVTVIGSGAGALKDQSGNPFNGGTNATIPFTLNAGAQVQAVVPQPISRNSTTLQLSQSGNTVDVYFNNDQLNAVSNITSPGNVKNPAYYQLINTGTQNIEHPTSVAYTFDAVSGLNKATLVFATTIPKGTYNLQIGTVQAPSNTRATAVHVGGPITAIHSYIGDNPTLSSTQIQNDIDVYRFEVQVAGNFNVTLTSFGGLNGAVRIFNTLGNAVGGFTDATGVGGVEVRTDVLAVGTYYVGVSRSGNTSYDLEGNLISTGGAPTDAGAYTLSVSFATPTPLSDQTSFAEATTSANVGVLGQAGLTVSGSISTRPYNLIWPGADDLPGHRDIPDEDHLGAGPAIDTASVPVIPYNFQDVYGFDPQSGVPLHNAITANQMARTREILQLYSRYAGVEFVETPNLGMTIATGDLRAISITVPTGGTVRGLADPINQIAVMNAGVNWGNSEYGGDWFQTAMHEIGHLMGLGHTYDLPGLGIMGQSTEDLSNPYSLGSVPGEPVFPGDNDILHTQALYRPASRDIDLYKFTLTEAGQWSATTIAQQVKASASTDFNTVGLVTMRFDAVADGAAGSGVQMVFTKSDRGVGAAPGIAVNPVTRVVSVDLNMNATSGTTAQGLIAALSANVAASQLVSAQVTAGAPFLQIATAAIPINYSPLTLTANSSLLDSVLSVYQENVDATTGAVTRELIARNDDYYGKDSFVNLHLKAGSYYVGVTSKGNTDFNPNVSDTGLGGTTEGPFQLKLNFTPDGNTVSIRDVSGTPIDGDADGQPGGTFNFYFQSNPSPTGTLFVDKSYTGATSNGQILTPYKTISAAIAAAPALLASQGAGGVELIRIVGNGGTDRNLSTPADNLPYLIGYNYNGTPLADGQDLLVPKGVTLMVDAGALLKFRKANIDVGSSAQGVDRSHAAIQVLGTPQITTTGSPSLVLQTGAAYFTSFANDLLGGDSNGTTASAGGDWGGIVMRADSDYDHQVNPLFLNYVNHANLSYGGGKVVVNSIESVYNPLHMISSRPNLSFNTITLSADSAISADPNSFDDSLGRLGPNLHANTLVNNTLNALLVRIRTQFGSPVDVLTVNGRFHNTDVTYVIPEDLYINGSPGGPTSTDGVNYLARPSARLLIDPGVVVKMSTSRIEARIGSQLIAEGTAADPIIFTALADTRFGAGGTFATQKSGAPIPLPLTPQGLWSGLFFGADSKGSIDNAQIYFAGGLSPIEGGFATFSPIEAYQGDVRITNSLLQYNQNGQGSQGPDGKRNGRGNNTTTGGATLFVRGAQPIVVNNIIRDNAGQVMSINANAMTVTVQPDSGRSTGLLANFAQFGDNEGPLVRLNRLVNNGTNGLEVRGATLTTATAWDDTDIAHVLRQEIITPNFHSVGGLTLKSAPNESLVVKAQGATAGLTASGRLLDINDRIGGSIFVLGQPGRPVIFTSLADDSVSSGLQPLNDLPLFDTNNNGSATTPQPGDWRGLKLDQFSNDRNVRTVYETESVYAGATSTHGDPQHAQFLGNLAPDVKSGDDNRKLGFVVPGNISLNNTQNVDVYSFTADSGTEVWINLDHTSNALQGIVELVDANGTTLARSVVRSNDHNANMVNKLTGLAADMTKDVQDTSAGPQFLDGYAGRNYYSLNSVDPGMRVVLPGDGLKQATYFVRVRSQDTARASTDFGLKDAFGKSTVTAIFQAASMGLADAGVQLSFARADLGANTPPAIVVSGTDISVTLNTNPLANGVSPTTLQNLITALNANPLTSALGTASFTGVGTTDITTQPTAGYSPLPRVSQDNDLTQGKTSGHYQLNIRLRQMDEIPGSQIRYSNVAYATTGIDVQGLPLHSYLAGESTNAGNGNNVFGGAQDLGNLLTSDRNALSVSGNLAGLGDVQWFSFNIDYDLIQAIAGVNAGTKTWSTIFDFDYSDGLARPDATISVFDSTGRQIFIGRDSNVDSDRPAAGQGTDLDDTSRGSVGALDPYIGPAQLPAGVPGQTHRYFVAVSSNRGLPSAMDGTFQAAATTPLVRLEPVDSMRRIIEDHVDFSGGGTAAAPDSTAINDVTTVAGLRTNVTPYNLSDVQLYVAQRGTLGIVDPYTGAQRAGVGGLSNMTDITMRSDGTMFGYENLPGVAATIGRLVQINPETGATTVIGNDNIPDYDPATNPPDRQQDSQGPPTALALRGHASLGLADAAVGGDMVLFYAVPDQFSPNVSRLYRADSETGTAAVTTNRPWGRVGTLITDASNSAFATGTTTFGDNTAGAPAVTFESQLAGANGNGTRIIFVRVFSGSKPAAAVTAVNQAAKTVTIEINGTVKTASASTNFGLLDNNGNDVVRVNFVAVNPGTAGNGVTLNFSKADLGPATAPTITVAGKTINVILNQNPAGSTTIGPPGSPTTAQDVVNALNTDPFAKLLVSASVASGSGAAVVTTKPTNQYSPVILAGGQDPATAQDVIDAVNNSALAFPLIQNVTGTGNLNVDITGIDPNGPPAPAYSPLTLTGGINGLINSTTGMAFDNQDRLWGVSDSGALYRISTLGGKNLASNTITVPGAPVFTGLTRGPQNLYNGAYKDLFFASTTSGAIYALDPAAALANQPANVLKTVFGAADAIDPTPNLTASPATPPTAIDNTVGLVFSPLDFNLFHPSGTRGGDAGHGINAAPDNSRTPSGGGTSFYFGFEKFGAGYVTQTDGPSQAQYGILTNIYHQDLSVNPLIGATGSGGNYNLPGGGHGSIISNSFSLQGYSALLKPTAYFTYFVDGSLGASVSISTNNGTTWRSLSGNPAFISASITDAPANPSQRLQPMWTNTGSWRQLRVDLSEFAGLNNLRLRFDASSGITDLQHEGFYFDDIIVGFAGRGEMVTGSSAGVTGFFVTPTPVIEPGALSPPPSQVVNGPYQLEIRRGTEYGAVIDPNGPDIALFQSYDVRDNFVPDDRDVIRDGFETGNFGSLSWVNSSPSPWRVVNTANATGLLSAQAGVASFSPTQTSDLSLSVKTGTGQVSFSRKVSSNVGSGVLRFYIDGVLQGEWSGDVPMGQVSFPVTPNVGNTTHTFRWSYQKDAADSPTTGILDTAWIDDVRYQAANIDFESTAVGGLPSIFHTSTTPTEVNHFYSTPPGTAPILFNRQSQGELPWFVTNTTSNTGTNSVRSAVIPSNSYSTLSLVKQTGEGSLSFAFRVSSSAGNGVFQFYIDGVAQFVDALGNPAPLSGNLAWQTRTFTGLSAGYHTFVWQYSKNAAAGALLDATFIDDLVFPTPNIGTGSIGDQNQYREQGSIVIEENKVTDSATNGIAVHPGPRGAGGSLPFPSSVIFGPTLNNARLTDGVALVNNVVSNYGQNGILFAGDPNNGQPAAAVPFGRIFNNTVYGGATATGVAIRVQNNAGPTLLNNIVANAVIGISVDNTSSANTVIGTTVYQGNTTNIVYAGTQTNPIVLPPGDPLFVDPTKRNFYLADGSQAIDSSVDKLDDRFNYVAVKNPLAIGESPIIAPITDLFGQLRADDPSNGPTGGGQNIFKDIGAIDRVDFDRPTAQLTVPLDNDPAGVDLDPTADSVLIDNSPLSKFSIQLADVGIGVDDGIINTSQFALTADGVPLVDGTDYIFVYNANQHLATLLPSSGNWQFNVQYVITLDNSAATGIKDIAGNTLLPNNVTGPNAGKTVFTIYDGILYSYGTAPAPYPTTLADDGAQHLIVPGMYLGTFVQPRLDGAPTVPPAFPNGDGDGGISNISLISGLPSHFDVKASLAGKLDVWIDVNQDGTWDNSEHAIVAKNIPAGTSTVNFTMPTQSAGTTVARFRYSSAGVALPTGPALDGEVDDYQVTIGGAPFQNPVEKLDVTNDTHISSIDALRIINFISRYGSFFAGAPTFGNIPLPNFTAISPPGYPVAAPDYLDVSGDGFVAANDANMVLTWLNDPANNPPPNGEGEGEDGGIAPASILTAGSVTPAPSAIPPVIYANSSVVVETKSSARSESQVVDHLFGSGKSLVGDTFQPVIDELHPASNREQRLEVKSRQRKESENSWDDLLGDLAADVSIGGNQRRLES